MSRKILALLMAVVCFWPTGGFAAVTQVDSLIEKLMEKGILDKAEARELRKEIAEDAKAITEDTAKSQVPDWVLNTKLKGDARVRYQYERRANDTDARTRGRIRLRLGLENKVNDQWKMGAGLATAEVASTTDDARSTNMTMTDSFRRGDIRLDYAFGEYQPAPWGKAIFGKFVKTDYLWNTSDFIWDTDINPAGASVHLDHKFNDNLSVFSNTGAWVIDENNKADRVDPFLFYGQGGTKATLGKFDATMAGIFYGFNGLKGTTMDGTASSNTLTGAVLKYDYDSVGASGELGLKDPTFGLLPVARFAVFGDWIRNIDSGNDDGTGGSSLVDEGTGWAAGVKFGDEKVNGANQWQWKYQYVNLGKDAFPDAFPDSDRIGGITDVKGHEMILEYGLSKNVVLGFDYYQDQTIKAAHNQQRIIQADLNIKF